MCLRNIDSRKDKTHGDGLMSILYSTSTPKYLQCVNITCTAMQQSVRSRVPAKLELADKTKLNVSVFLLSPLINVLHLL